MCEKLEEAIISNREPKSSEFRGRTFDLDGGGPEPARLIAATDFGVWVWDSVNWRPLGEGLDRTFVLTTFNGSLVAAGQWIGMEDQAVVVRWNGNGWVQLGGSFAFSNSVPKVNDVTVFQGELRIHAHVQATMCSDNASWRRRN